MFGRSKLQPEAWWSFEVKAIVSERRKEFDSAHMGEIKKARITSLSLGKLYLPLPRPRLNKWYETFSYLS